MKPHEVQELLPKHLDHDNIETFEVKDLEKLIRKATVDLEELDKLRREEFKQHEMQKELDRRQRLEVYTISPDFSPLEYGSKESGVVY